MRENIPSGIYEKIIVSERKENVRGIINGVSFRDSSEIEGLVGSKHDFAVSGNRFGKIESRSSGTGFEDAEFERLRIPERRYVDERIKETVRLFVSLLRKVEKPQKA